VMCAGGSSRGRSFTRGARPKASVLGGVVDLLILYFSEGEGGGSIMWLCSWDILDLAEPV